MPFLPNQQWEKHTFPKLSNSNLTFYMQTRSNQIFKPSPCYDTGINKNIQILILNFNKVLAISDWESMTKLVKQIYWFV